MVKILLHPGKASEFSIPCLISRMVLVPCMNSNCDSGLVEFSRTPMNLSNTISPTSFLKFQLPR